MENKVFEKQEIVDSKVVYDGYYKVYEKTIKDGREVITTVCHVTMCAILFVTFFNELN